MSARDQSAGAGRLAAPAGSRGWPAALIARLAAAFAGNLAAERERWILWAPVAFAAGIGLYFSLPVEPPLWPWIAAALVVLGLWAALARGRPDPASGTTAVLGVGAIGLALVLAGGAAATFRAQSVAAPVLSRSLGPARITGRIVEVEDLPAGQRLILDGLRIPGLGREATPERARVRLRGRDDGLLVGERVAILAKLGPPPAPAAPAAFAFQRPAYFSRLGAVGFAFGRAHVLNIGTAGGEPGQEAGDGEGRASALTLWLSGLRQTIIARVRAALPGRNGAVAAALMTGDQGAIPADVLTDMRNSGLAHLLAVSGLHFVLVAGSVFFAVRGLLALVPPLALRYPIKKWAAVAALLSALGYLGVAGQSVATERAFIMAALVFLAVLVDRTAISMRTMAGAPPGILGSPPPSPVRPRFPLSLAAGPARGAGPASRRDRGRVVPPRGGRASSRGRGGRAPGGPAGAAPRRSPSSRTAAAASASSA